jgi:hypothetical protein
MRYEPESLADEIGRIAHAFSDRGRKDDVRALADRVARLKAERDAANESRLAANRSWQERYDDLSRTLGAVRLERDNLHANADNAICTWCGHVGPKDNEAMVDHMMGCAGFRAAAATIVSSDEANRALVHVCEERDEAVRALEDAHRMVSVFLGWCKLGATWSATEAEHAEVVRVHSVVDAALARLRGGKDGGG